MKKNNKSSRDVYYTSLDIPNNILKCRSYIDLRLAINDAKRKGYNVYNSKLELVYEYKEDIDTNDNIQHIHIIRIGDKIELNDDLIYRDYNKLEPINRFSGIFYYYDSKIINNMVRITKNPDKSKYKSTDIIGCIEVK